MKYFFVFGAVCFVFLLCDVYVLNPERWNSRRRKKRDILTEIKKLDNNEDLWELLTKKSSDKKESQESENQDYDYDTVNLDYKYPWTDETSEPVRSSKDSEQQTTESLNTKSTTSFTTLLPNKMSTESPPTEKIEFMASSTTETTVELTSSPLPNQINEQLLLTTTISNMIPSSSQPANRVTIQSGIPTFPSDKDDVLTFKNPESSTTKNQDITTTQPPKTETTITDSAKITSTQLPQTKTTTSQPPKTEATTPKSPETTTTQSPKTETISTSSVKTTSTQLPQTKTTTSQPPKTEATTPKFPETTTTQSPKTEITLTSSVKITSTQLPQIKTTTSQPPKTEATTPKSPETTTTQSPKTETTLTSSVKTTSTQLPQTKTTTSQPPKTETTTSKSPESTITGPPPTETTTPQPTKAETITTTIKTRLPQTETPTTLPTTTEAWMTKFQEKKATTTQTTTNKFPKTETTTTILSKTGTPTTQPPKADAITTHLPKAEFITTQPLISEMQTTMKKFQKTKSTTVTPSKSKATTSKPTKTEATTKKLPKLKPTKTKLLKPETQRTTKKPTTIKTTTTKPTETEMTTKKPSKMESTKAKAPKIETQRTKKTEATITKPPQKEITTPKSAKAKTSTTSSTNIITTQRSVTTSAKHVMNTSKPKACDIFKCIPNKFKSTPSWPSTSTASTPYKIGDNVLLKEKKFMIPESSPQPNKPKNVTYKSVDNRNIDKPPEYVHILGHFFPVCFTFNHTKGIKGHDNCAVLSEASIQIIPISRLLPREKSIHQIPSRGYNNFDPKKLFAIPQEEKIKPEIKQPLSQFEKLYPTLTKYYTTMLPPVTRQKTDFAFSPHRLHPIDPIPSSQDNQPSQVFTTHLNANKPPQLHLVLNERPEENVYLEQLPTKKFIVENPISSFFKLPVILTEVAKDHIYHEKTKDITKISCLKCPGGSSRTVLELPDVGNQDLKFIKDGRTVLPKNEFVTISLPKHIPFHLYGKVSNHYQGQASPKVILHPVEDKIIHRWKRSTDETDDAVSLAFVFDTTGSMSTELHLVKESALKITTDLLNNSNIKIHDFIFVPFNDFNNKPQPTRTKDRHEFINAINSVHIGGGIDCPEQSLKAILKAINLSRPNSFIYVFTDAFGKDYETLVPQIVTLTQRKHPQIFFLLTGYCFDKKYPYDQRMAYSIIASVSSGLVIDLAHKSDIKKVFNYITENSKQGKVLLNSVSFKKGIKNPYVISLNIDPTIKEMTVSTTGVNVSLSVLNPEGSQPNQNEIQNLLNLDNIKVFCVQQPKPGIWKINVTKARSAHSVITTGLSSNTFLYGFSIIPTYEIKETSINPKKGAQNYLLIKTTSPELTDRVLSATLVNLDGVILGQYNTTNVYKDTYIIGPFVPPDQLFKLKIHGETKDGFPIQRISTIAISPQMPEKPFISGKTSITGTIGEPVDIKCHIQSLVPVAVKMFKTPSVHIMSKSFSQSSEISHHIPNVSKDDEGVYVCSSQNIAGVANLTINLAVKENPPVVVLDKKAVLAHLGETVDIHCRVHSLTPHRLSWMKISDDSSHHKYITETDQSSRSIHFNPLTKQDAGVYVCSAKNGGGENSVQITVEVVQKPEVTVSNNEIYFKINRPILLECKVTKGIPTPTIKWFKSYFILNTSEEIGIQYDDNSVKLEIEKAKKSDQGVYICFASNSAGTYQKEVNVYLGQEPVVSIHYYKNIIYSQTGKDLSVQCKASGIPKPYLEWKKKTDNGFSDVNHSNGVLNIKSPTFEDSGRYVCIASNPIGHGEDSIFITFGTKPQIETETTDVNLEIYSVASLSCTTSGIPEPRITWRRKDGKNVQAVSTENILEFRNITLMHQGIYVCKAENYFGEDEKEVNVSIIGTTPPKIIQSESEEIVKHLIGERVELQCILKEGKPWPKIRWEQYGGNGDTLELYGFVAENGSLIFNTLSIRVIANYSCIAENGVGVDRKNVTLQQYEPPVIHERSATTVTAKVGNPAILHCETTGDPKPTVKWSRDSYQFNSIMTGYRKENSTSLYFDAVRVEDSGRYKCHATNIAGEMTKEVTLQVFVPPKIISWKKEVSVELGNVVSLKCNAVGLPKPDVKWLKDNIPLKKYSSMLGNEVWFTSETSDAGVYTCLAENKAGMNRADTVLEILERPVINNLPHEIEVIKGKQAVLMCKATGYPTPKVHWEFNENILYGNNDGNGSTILNISKALDSDEGIYSCVASNKVNTVTKKVHLFVLEPPFINPWVEIMKAALGEEIVLECNAVAKPKPEIAWFLNSEPFTEGYLSPEGFLRFQVNKNHSGDFNCIATNKAGSDSKKITLLILEPPKFAPNLPNTVQALSGNNVDLLCLAFGEPEPTVYWEQYNSLLPNTKKSFSSKNNTLTIYNITVDDEDSYVCHAENKAGISSYTVKLIVFDIPKTELTINIAPNSAIYENQEIILSCEISGKPAPKVVWYKDGKLIQNQYIFNSTVLRFMAMEEDSGNFTCIASNSVGSDNSTLQIIVKAEPKFENPEDEKVIFVENSDAVLTCKVKGSPVPKLIWLQNGMLIKDHYMSEGNGTSTLHIKNVTYKNSGKYSCMAVNILGEKEKIYHIIIQSPPSIADDTLPTKLSLNFGEDFAIPCTVKGHPKPQVKWKIGDEFVSPKITTEFYMTLDDNTLVLMNMSEKMAGEYECIATNNQGTVKKVYQVTVSAPTSPIPKDFELVEELDGNPAKLHCLAKPGEEIIWFKNGVNIRQNRIRSDVDQYEVKDNGMRLSFDEVYSSTGGNYTCIIKRKDKSITKNFFLDVISMPYFLDHFYEYELKVEEGKSTQLNCNMSGNPHPKVTWRFARDGSLNQIPITNLTLPGVKMSNGFLKISKTQLSHNGTYLCLGSNKVGSIKRTFNIKISRDLKRVENKFEVKYFIESEPLELQCDAGEYTNSYQWEFQSSINSNWNSILSDNTNIVKRKEASKFHHGLFNCKRESAKEKIDKKIQVNIIVLPSFAANDTTEFTIMESRSFELHCIVFYLTEVKVTWNFRQRKIEPNNTNFLITEIGNKHILHVFNSSKANEGIYSCLAKNRAGKDEQSFKVKIIAPLKYLKDISTKLYQTEGLPLKIKCPIWSDLKSEIQWEKDNVLIDKIYGYMNQSDYIIEKANLSNTGSYKCKVINPGSNLEATVDVFILVPPKILPNSSAKLLEVSEGSNITINCFTSGIPLPSVSWRKKNSNIETLHTSSYHKNCQQLKIYNITLKESGSYTCTVQNEVGQDERHFEVIVRGSNSVNKNVTVIKIDSGTPLILECTVTGNIRQNITWFKGNSLLKTSKQELKFDEVKEVNSGIYYCANNSGVINTFYLIAKVKLYWSEWSQWSSCSKSCDGGEKIRTRVIVGRKNEPLNNYFIEYDNSTITGPSEEKRQCDLFPCSPDGIWSEWQEWSSCSSSCGNGVRHHTRKCLSSHCNGQANESETCNLNPCPINGGWSDWSEWNDCSATCGSGVKMRVRLCTNPKPEFDGENCPGPGREIVQCTIKKCSIDKWSPWSVWSPCSVSCGRGIQIRKRVCLLESQDSTCQGNKTQMIRCKKQSCNKRQKS